MKKEDEIVIDELEDEVDDLDELEDEVDEDDLTPAKPKKKGKKKSWLGRAVDFGKSTCKKIAPAAKEFAKGVAHGTGVVATLGVAALAVVKLAGSASGGTRTDADDQGYLSGPEAVKMEADPINSNPSTDQTDEIEDAEIISETEMAE